MDKKVTKTKNNNVFSREVKLIPKPLYILQGIGSALLKGVLWLLDLLLSMITSLLRFFGFLFFAIYKAIKHIIKFLKRKAHQFRYNDWSGRLSFLIFGLGSFRHKQIINGILYLFFEIGYLLFFFTKGINSIALLKTLGTMPSGPDPECIESGELACDWITGHNSVMVLVYGLLTVFSVLLFLYIMNRSFNAGYNNYRIKNYLKFSKLYKENEEFSYEIDELAKNAIDNNVNYFEFKNEIKDNVNSFLSKFNDKRDRNFSKYLISFTVNNAYIDYKNINKEVNKLDKYQEKYDNYIESRKEDFELIDKEDQILVDKFNNKTRSVSSDLLLKLRKQRNKVHELKKRHAPYAIHEKIVADNKYEKFNIYYKVRSLSHSKLTFYTNYKEICKVYDDSYGKYEKKNSENINSIQEIKKNEILKIEKINAKFDEIIAKRASIEQKLNEVTLERDNLCKQHKNNSKKVLEIKADYFPEISKLSAQFAKLPSLKAIKAMRNEEIKEVKHASKRDRKALTTNYTALSYAKEEAVNKMIVDYKLDYTFALSIVNQVNIASKKDDSIKHLTTAEVEKKIKEINKEDEVFVKENKEKYIGKTKTFKEQMNSLVNENFHVTVLTLPILGVILFVVMPLFFSILVAFTNYSRGHIPPTELFTWYGLKNFLTLFNPSDDSIYKYLPSSMFKTLSWTITWTIVATFSNYLLGIILALLINKKGIKLKKLWRTIFIMTIAIPQFITLMSIGILLKDSGAIGSIWPKLFGTKLGFGTDATNGAFMSKVIIILVNIWVGIPYTMLSTTGILMNIPEDLYESARVDGAGPVAQFNKITLPYILFVTGPYLITQFIGNINNFNVIFFLTGGGPSFSGSALPIGHTDLLITFIYKIISSNNNPQYGIASAVGIVVFVICSFFSIIMYNKSGSVQAEDQFQ